MIQDGLKDGKHIVSSDQTDHIYVLVLPIHSVILPGMEGRILRICGGQGTHRAKRAAQESASNADY